MATFKKMNANLKAYFVEDIKAFQDNFTPFSADSVMDDASL